MGCAFTASSGTRRIDPPVPMRRKKRPSPARTSGPVPGYDAVMVTRGAVPSTGTRKTCTSLELLFATPLFMKYTVDPDTTIDSPLPNGLGTIVCGAGAHAQGSPSDGH